MDALYFEKFFSVSMVTIRGRRKGGVGGEVSGKLKVGQGDDLDSSSSDVPSVYVRTYVTQTNIIYLVGQDCH